MIEIIGRIYVQNYLNILKSFNGERYIRSKRQIKKGFGKTSNFKCYASATSKQRSRTFKGIADAMAEQWGGLCE